ncbi:MULTISPECIES: hypothetical protein [Thermoanaerobacterium]|nr:MULTISPECIES: hypothetical protein [Thermoanaerobacterium]
MFLNETIIKLDKVSKRNIKLEDKNERLLKKAIKQADFTQAKIAKKLE